MVGRLEAMGADSVPVDTALARTFLEVSAAGSFVAAAARLHLTQTAVAARIRLLESQLGRPLFVRMKSGVRLTPAGRRFERHAAAMVQLWERARQQVALPPGRESMLGIGGELSLWHPWLADWLVWMHRVCPEVAVRAQVDGVVRLLDSIEHGSLDLALVYDPPRRPGLVCELLAEEKLVLVTTASDGQLRREHYVHVDWGPGFAINHQAAFPELGDAPMSISLGPLALAYVLQVGGAGYFRIGTVRPFLLNGQLRQVQEAPPFSYSAFVVYARHRDDPLLARARAGLRMVADRPAAFPLQSMG